MAKVAAFPSTASTGTRIRIRRFGRGASRSEHFQPKVVKPRPSTLEPVRWIDRSGATRSRIPEIVEPRRERAIVNIDGPGFVETGGRRSRHCLHVDEALGRKLPFRFEPKLLVAPARTTARIPKFTSSVRNGFVGDARS